MKKYSKKIALILALALTLGIAIPVLAFETNISGSYTATGIQEINIVVSGGSNVRAFLNPGEYKADVYSNNDDVLRLVNPGTNYKAIGQLDPSGDITTMPIVGVNMGKSDVKVRAAVTSTLSGKFKFASGIPSEKSTTGLVFLEAQALGNSKTENNAAYELGYDSDIKGKWYNAGRYDAFDGAKVLNALNSWKHDVINNTLYATSKDRDEKAQQNKEKKEFSDWWNVKKKTNYKLNKADTFYQDEVIVLKKGTAECKQQLCTVKAAVDDVPSYFLARLSGRVGKGDLASNKADKKWNSSDGFGAYIVWTFETTAN